MEMETEIQIKETLMVLQTVIPMLEAKMVTVMEMETKEIPME